MSLHVPPPPKGGLKIIREAVGGLMSQPGSRTAAVIAVEEAADLEAAVPHAVYFVGANYVAEGSLLASAEHSGWRFILLSGERAILAAELSFERESGDLEFSNMNDGPLVSGTVEGVRVAEGLQEIRDAEYELRLLEIPSLSVAALWFHADEKDLLMPIPPTRRGLEPFAVYTDRELLNALHDAAVERLLIKDDRA